LKKAAVERGRRSGSAANGAPRGLRLWWLAARPRTLTLALTPVVVGAALAWAEGAAPSWPSFAAALACALLIQAGTNLHNDAADFERGNDRSDRVGPVRVTAAGWATPAQVRGAAHLAFALALAGGLYLVWVGGLPILLIGLASLALGYAYSGGPRPLSHTPLGELFVLLFFGLVAVAGSHYLQSGRLSPAALVGGFALGCFAAAVLLVNNYRDLEQDKAAGRRTLAGLLGRRRACWLYALFMLAPFAALATLAARLPEGAAALPALLALPACLRLALGLGATPLGPALNRVLAATAGAQVRYGLPLALGLTIAAWAGTFHP
jgi:1,4-dihydroxy-2-naphthoate octaprenyltransferase